jgi:hypothetical protein
VDHILTFKMVTGVDLIGKFNTDPDVNKDFAHIPNAIVLDDAVVIGINVMKDEATGQARAQVGFDPVAIPVEGQGAARIALNPANIAYQYSLEGVYRDGYIMATSTIQLPPGGGGKIIV